MACKVAKPAELVTEEKIEREEIYMVRVIQAVFVIILCREVVRERDRVLSGQRENQIH